MSEALRVNDLWRTFVDGKRHLEVLKGVSLGVKSGEMVALVGRSGSGKSSLLHLLGLLDRPDQGELYIDGAPAARISETQRAALRSGKIGFVFQHFFLLPEFTVFENLLMAARVSYGPAQWLLGRRKEAIGRAEELLEKVDLCDQRNQKSATLSGGERQRVGLARALMASPTILLCDEPTGNLDPDTGTLIMRHIGEMSKQDGIAVMIATHDLKLAKQADKVLRLEDGHLRKEA